MDKTDERKNHHNEPSKQDPSRKRPSRPKRNNLGGFRGGDNDSGSGQVMRTIMIWLAIFGFVVITYMLFNNSQQSEISITYTEYKQMLDANKIESAIVTKSQLNDFVFHGTLKEKVTIIKNNNPIEVSRDRKSVV